MGAENSVLENCTWNDEVTAPSGSDWSLKHATLRDDTCVSVFQHKKTDKRGTDFLFRGTKNLRTLRHPNLLRFIASGNDTNGSYLVTEQVRPLENCLPSLHPLEICSGLHSILEALLFLHDTVGVTHNNICLASIFVANDGSWKLGGLEHSCKFLESTPEFLDKCLAFRDEDSISPEEKQGNISATIEQGHARDVFAFGVFAEQLIEILQDLGDLTKTFELRVQDECLNIDPSQRPRVRSLLNDRLFRHDFIDILQFLKTLTTKSEEEKKEFFSNVTPKLLLLPEVLVAKSLGVLLLSRFVMLDETANTCLLPSLMTPYHGLSRPQVVSGRPTPILSQDLFKTHIIPELYRIFHIRDVHIRLVLLKHFASYVDLFKKETLEDVVFPQLLIGLRDTDDRIVAASLSSLSFLVPILGGDLIIGGPRKKFFTEGMPKFHNHSKDDQNRKTKNVSGIMGKKLLKDLAGYSNGPVSVDEEKDGKKKERDRRREEARQRREERKKRLQEQQMNETNKQAITEEVMNKDETLNGEESTGSQQEVIMEENEKDKADWSDWEDENNPQITVNTVSTYNMESKHNSETMRQSEGESFNSDVSFDEDQFSDEIEKELSNMPSTVPLHKKSEELLPAPEVDWGNVPLSDPSILNLERSRSSGALKLGQSKSKSSEKSKSEKFRSLDKGKKMTLDKSVGKKTDKLPDQIIPAPQVKSETDDWGETWDIMDSSLANDNPIPSSVKVSKKTINIPKPTGDLGAEFDIKVKKMTTPSKEVDFFSDMMPEIKVDPKDPLSELVKGAGSKQGPDPSVKKEEVKSMSFAVVDVGETQGGDEGWGDDLEWGNEDF